MMSRTNIQIVLQILQIATVNMVHLGSTVEHMRYRARQLRKSCRELSIPLRDTTKRRRINMKEHIKKKARIIETNLSE